MRAPTLAVLLSLALPAAAKVRPSHSRDPWLLFPLDLRRFEEVSSRFGMRRLGGFRKLHRGVDLVAPPGSYVVAAREGVIAHAGRSKSCGYYVTVAHSNGWRTVYCHLRSDPRTLGIFEGLYVQAMSVVGEVGSTGHSTGPHLHFTLLDDRGHAHDPLLSMYTPRETLAVMKQMGLAR
ncbi:MAG TPA: M23 family metallopeptidase [Myxococcales bacterium]|nr:M23 family metallopeptidase [Myxococcales bacterium]